MQDDEIEKKTHKKLMKKNHISKRSTWQKIPKLNKKTQ